MSLSDKELLGAGRTADALSDEELLRHLQEAEPSALKIPNRNADGLIASNAPSGALASRWPHTPSVTKSFQAPFPETEPAITQQDITQTKNANEYSFELEVSKIDTAAGTVKVHIGYGEINDTPPSGMTGADDYFATISVDGTEFWAVVTYDTTSLAITSRSLNWGPAVPTSTLGTLYIPFGFVDITTNPVTGKITEANPHNRFCGDINVGFIYGAFNAAAALFPRVQLSEPQPIP